MNIGAVSTASLASAVWSATTRNLTNLGALASSSVGTQTSIAAASSVDLRQASGFIADINVGIKTGGGATAPSTINIYDGTNSIALASTGAGSNSPQGFTGWSGTSVGVRLTNSDAAIAATYMFVALIWKS